MIPHTAGIASSKPFLSITAPDTTPCPLRPAAGTPDRRTQPARETHLPSGKLGEGHPTAEPRPCPVQANASRPYGPSETQCFASLNCWTLRLGGALMREAAG